MPKAESQKGAEWVHLEAERTEAATLTALGGRKGQRATLDVVLKRVLQGRQTKDTVMSHSHLLAQLRYHGNMGN